VVREAALAARERRRVQARLLNRSRSGARRALKGLRFISRTTTDADGGAALWRAVEERFNALATDGLLARDDFGDCIGTYVRSFVQRTTRSHARTPRP
jgi:respiratory burst oxidase